MEIKVIDGEGKILTEYDLTKGRLITRKLLRKDAKPIDNITKFAWEEDDYEEVRMYIPNREKSKAMKINELKEKLSTTNQKIIDCSEYYMLGLELPYDIATLHVERQAIRDQIKLLENS